jgi:hypothetical protein
LRNSKVQTQSVPHARDTISCMDTIRRPNEYSGWHLHFITWVGAVRVTVVFLNEHEGPIAYQLIILGNIGYSISELPVQKMRASISASRGLPCELIVRGLPCELNVRDLPDELNVRGLLSLFPARRHTLTERDQGPRPRSSSEPLGLKHPYTPFTKAESQTINLGNYFRRRSLLMGRTAHALDILAVIESLHLIVDDQALGWSCSVKRKP